VFIIRAASLILNAVGCSWLSLASVPALSAGTCVVQLQLIILLDVFGLLRTATAFIGA